MLGQVLTSDRSSTYFAHCCDVGLFFLGNKQAALQHPGQSMPLLVRRGGKQQPIEIRAQQSPVRLGVRIDTGTSDCWASPVYRMLTADSRQWKLSEHAGIITTCTRRQDVINSLAHPSAETHEKSTHFLYNAESHLTYISIDHTITMRRRLAAYLSHILASRLRVIC